MTHKPMVIRKCQAEIEKHESPRRREGMVYEGYG